MYFQQLLSQWDQLPNQQKKNYTGTFDSVFSIISKSTATTGILYKRVAPFANLVNYNSNVRTSVDTSNFTHFIQAYSELYRSAFDTSVRQPWSVADFESQIENYDSSGVVDIGILHYNFNTMDSLVAMQKLIIVDSVLIGEDTAVTASLYSRQTAKCDLNIQLIYDCECLGTFNLNIHNSKSELEHYFEQNASNLDMIFENNNLHKSFDLGILYQNILLPKKVCLEMLNIDSSLFIEVPEIVKGVDYDTLQFELEPEKICEDINITLKNNCSVCQNEDFVTLNFYNIDISFHGLYSTCEGTKYDIKNCGKSVPYFIECTYYKIDSTGNIIDTLDGDIITEVGDYIVTCVDITTKEEVGKNNFSVSSTDLEGLPFSVGNYKIVNISKENNPNKCEYTVELEIKFSAANNSDSLMEQYRNILEQYEFDLLYNSSAGLKSANMSTESNVIFYDYKNSCFNYYFIKQYLITTNCEKEGNIDFANLKIYSANRKLLLCNAESVIGFPPCCDSYCEDCITISVNESPISDKSKNITIANNCYNDKMIVKAESFYLLNDTMKYNIHIPDSTMLLQNNFAFTVTADCMYNSSQIANYLICVNFDDGTKCCDTIEFSYSCKTTETFQEVLCNVYSNPETTGFLNISVGLQEQIKTPLTIEILDQVGNLMIPVYNAIPPFTEEIFRINVNSLIPGSYNVLYRIEDEVITVPFIKL